VIETKNYALAKAKYEQLYARYEKELALKQETISKKRKELQELKQKNERTARFRNRLAMLNMQSTGLAKSFAVRLFTVHGFGLYNSDCPQKLPQSAPLALTLLDSKTDTLSVKKLHLVELDRNRMYTFNELTEKVQYNKKSNNLLICISNDGYYFSANNEVFENIKPKDGKASITMKPLGKIEDVNQLEDLLEI